MVRYTSFPIRLLCVLQTLQIALFLQLVFNSCVKTANGVANVVGNRISLNAEKMKPLPRRQAVNK